MLPVIRFALAFAAISTASVAAAHGSTGEPVGWTFDPWVIVPLALVLAVFLIGRGRLAHRSANAARSPWLFVGGWSVLTLALVSPLHDAGERRHREA